MKHNNTKCLILKRNGFTNEQVEHNAKLRRDHQGKVLETTPLFPAIQLIHDPQALAEKLFKKLRQPGEKFEVKLLLMNFISRLIGCHKLVLLSFYSFLQRYLTSHQKDVSHILAYLIQVCWPACFCVLNYVCLSVCLSVCFYA